MIEEIIALFFPIALEPWPVSSSGHTTLLMHFFKLPWADSLLKMRILEHLVHGPIAIMILLFFGRAWFKEWRFSSWQKLFNLASYIFAADLLTFVLYGIWSKVGKSFFPVWLGFALTAYFLLISRKYTQGEKETLTFKEALFLGVGQGIALLPGISRFGLTFLIACMRGFKPLKAFEISFLLLIPISIGGFCLGLRDLYFSSVLFDFSFHQLYLISLVAIAVGLVGFYYVARLIASNRLWIIGLYECIPLVIALMLGL